MFTTIEDFITTWKDNTQKTLKLFQAIDEKSLDQEVMPGHRDINRLCWHLVQTVPEMMNRVGLHIQDPTNEDKLPKTTKELISAFQQVSDDLVNEITNNWTDDILKTEIEMYGMQWTIARTCRALLLHHVYHVGQISVLMRQAGLKPPYLYGPAKEDWAGMEMPEPVI